MVPPPPPDTDEFSLTEAFMAIEERVIASWKYKKGVLDPKTAYLCYLAANLAAGNTH
jgi:hypothetical protein